MSKRGVFLPLLEQILIGLSVVAKAASLSKDAPRVLVRATLSLVLLVHVFAIATPHLGGRLGADCGHSRRRSTSP